MTASQFLENNLLHGENARELNKGFHRVHSHTLLTPLVMPNQSRVWGVDLSHWNLPPVNIKRMVDLYNMRFAIFKGVDGSINSKYYTEHVAAAKAAGIPWGMYVWLYPNSRVSIDAQISAWYLRFQQDPPPMGLFIDAEWTFYGGAAANPSALDLRLAHDKWKIKSGKAATTYTAQGYADTYLKGFDWSREELWVANYGVTNPSLPTGAKLYSLWQFTDKLDGSALDPNGNAELDGSYFNGTLEQFNAKYQLTTTAPVDVLTAPHDGIFRISGTRYGWKFELFKVDPLKVRYEVTNPPALETVSQATKRTGAVLGINGSDWDRIGAVISLVGRPSFIVTNTDTILISDKPQTNVKGLVTGLRFIVQNGTLPLYLFGTEAQYTEGHARSIHGLTADGKHLILQSEGAYPNQGLTLKQAAEIMLQYGAVVAFDSGGGGDVTCILDGQSLITPENINPATGAHFERPLPQALLIYTKGLTMPNGTAKNISGSASAVRVKPSRYAADSGKPRPVNGAVIEFVKIADAVVSGPLDFPADKWLQLPDGNFVNHVLNGVPFYTVLTQPTPDPVTPPAPVVKIDTLTIEPAAGTVFTWLYSDGSVKKETV